MNRRSFFKRLVGATAAVALGPTLMAQVEEHPYQAAPKPSPPSQPQQVFGKGEGLWVFHKDELVAWSPIYGICINMTPEYLFLETKPEYEKIHRYDGVERIRQNIALDFDVSDLHIIQESAFHEMEPVKILFIHQDTKNGKAYKVVSDAIWTYLGLHAGVDEHIERSASFKCIKEPTTEITAI
jgi:hypothetical protein